MQLSQHDTTRHRWIRPVSGLCLAMSVILAVLMLYMPFQFQSATLRFLYPYLRGIGFAYGIAGILTGVAEVPIGMPGWAGKLGKLIFLGTLALQAYLIAFRPGVITGQFLYSLIIVAVVAALVRPDREWAILGALYGAASLVIGLLVLFCPGQFPLAVFGALPAGLGLIMIATGLLLIVALWMPGRLRPPLWAALLLVALPFLWFAWQWLLISNWVGISVYGSLGGWAAVCALYLRFPWHTSLTGLRMRILMLGLIMTALPLVTMGTFSVYVAQTLDAGEANYALRTAILQVERAAERLSAADADGEPRHWTRSLPRPRA
ncbi:MAG TPA: hypothetical protein VD969_09405 [Symbiobacteriaceae bacterium]|nr:hypothetical protein [Symbiobacteriaceae bacterium]